jgi:hypothetical protein
MAILPGEGQGGGETPSCRDLLNDILPQEEFNRAQKTEKWAILGLLNYPKGTTG